MAAKVDFLQQEAAITRVSLGPRFNDHLALMVGVGIIDTEKPVATSPRPTWDQASASQYALTALTSTGEIFGDSGYRNVIAMQIRTYLKKAGLLSYPKRGTIKVTDRWRKIRTEEPTSINVKFLRQFPEFVEFQTPQSNDADDTNQYLQVSELSGTPEEILEASFLTLKNQLLDDVLEKIKSYSPSFFEQLVVDVRVKMGYGGSRKDAGQAIGQGGDEGIDGIINEDRLGLDVIYLQAKRWDGNIGRPEIQKFAGALQGKRAKKGVFITTSNFTVEARDFAKGIDSKIVLISGKQLVELLWEHNVGLSASAMYEIKKIDFDYFSDS